MTAWSSSAKNPIEMHDTPLTSGGTIIWSSSTGARSTPSILGIEKPHTSASTMPTRLPRWARATARLVVTDDLPTPPLPDAISSTRVRDDGSANGMARPSACPWACCDPAVDAGSPWRSCRRAARSSSFIAPQARSTSVTPIAPSASLTRPVISPLSGQPGIVSTTVSATFVPSTTTSRTMPRSTMERCNSGSCTGRRASMTAVSFKDMSPFCDTRRASGEQARRAARHRSPALGAPHPATRQGPGSLGPWPRRRPRTSRTA